MAVSAAIKRKIARLRSGLPPRFIDLFSGCGGISLGFTTAGFEPIASVELDPRAAESHGANFAHISHGKVSEAHFVARNVTEERPAGIFKDIGLAGAVDEQVDVLVGGPPCQAFTRVGRAKLRHEARRREEVTAESAFLVDGRVNLWQHYLAYVRDTKPLALLMENVPDILNHGGTNVAEMVAEELRREGYVVRYTLLNAAWYGVPQTRERMFLIGIHRELEAEIRFPDPTHFAILPAGYEGTRATARKFIPQRGLELDHEHGHHWVDDPKPDAGLPGATTAADALADLPVINAIDLLAEGKIRKGAKSPLEPVSYVCSKPSTKWSRLMRGWPGFSTTAQTSGHVIRYLPRDYKIFREMEEGWQYPEVWSFVEDKRQRLLEGLLRQKPSAGRNSRAEEIVKAWTLPYDPKKFPNKWWKLVHDRPVRTLMAHLGKDSYSHIHFDSQQARPISIREAARLQSFPDGFVFRGSMNAAFKQVGNAVPPLMAYAIAREIRKSIGCQILPDMREELLGLKARSPK